MTSVLAPFCLLRKEWTSLGGIWCEFPQSTCSPSTDLNGEPLLSAAAGSGSARSPYPFLSKTSSHCAPSSFLSQFSISASPSYMYWSLPDLSPCLWVMELPVVDTGSGQGLANVQHMFVQTCRSMPCLLPVSERIEPFTMLFLLVFVKSPWDSSEAGWRGKWQLTELLFFNVALLHPFLMAGTFQIYPWIAQHCSRCCKPL